MTSAATAFALNRFAIPSQALGDQAEASLADFKTPDTSFQIANVHNRVLNQTDDNASALQDGEVLELSLMGLRHLIGTIEVQFTGTHSAEVLENFSASRPKGPDLDGNAMVTPQELQAFLKSAENSGATFGGTLGKNIDEIVSRYRSLLEGAALVLANGLEIQSAEKIEQNPTFLKSPCESTAEQAPQHLTWVDVQGQAAHADAFLQEHGLRGLPLLETHRRDNTKAALADKFLVGEVGLFDIDPNSPDKVIRREVQIVLGKNLLITSHGECSEFMRGVQEKFPQLMSIAPSKVDAGTLLGRVLSEIIRHNTSVLDALEARVNSVKCEVLHERVTPNTIKKTLPDLETAIQYFRRKQLEIGDLLEILELARLETDENLLFANGSNRNGLVPTRQRLDALIARALELESRIDGVGETHDRIRGSKTDSNVLRLTAIAAVLVPIEIVKFASEGIHFGQLAAVLLMSGALVLFGKRKNWW